MLGAMPLVQFVYMAVVGHGIPGLLLRGLFCGVCLLPPTIDDGGYAARGFALGGDEPARRLVAGDPSMAATPWARCSAVCSPASTCCAVHDMHAATLSRSP